MVVSYTKYLSESVKNIFNKQGTQVHFKDGSAIKNLQVALNNKDNITKNHGVIYRYKCTSVECDYEFRGKSASTLERGSRKNSRLPSPFLTTMTSQVIS